MTKPKIANGNCLNPIARLEKRFEEYKRCHQSAIKNCAKVQDSHNKSNDALKALLERKSKLSESKIKKKRSATATTTNRKKPKTSQDQSSNGLFETRVETTPNVTLNVHSSEIPDMDWDSFDILNNPNFSMSINEQELEGVLNSCYSQTTQPCSTKTADINLTNVCKTSPNLKHDVLFMQNSASTFKSEEKLFPPLFPPPENHTHSVAQQQQQQSVKFEYLSPQNYISSTTCTYNPTVGSNIVPPISNQIDHHQTATFNAHDNSMYTMNLPPSVNATNSLSYQYHNPLPPEPNTSAQYFYQYPDYGTVDHPSNAVDNFQLPAMSTGWYNNSLPAESVKPATCKLTIPQQQQQHQFVNASLAIANYRNNYSQYNQMAQHQDSSQMQYQQMFVNPNNNSTLVNSQSYDPTHSTIANYAMIPQDQPQQYYYMDYSTNGNRAGIVNSQSAGYVNNRNLINQNDPRLINHPSNPLLCRNVYQ